MGVISEFIQKQRTTNTVAAAQCLVQRHFYRLPPSFRRDLDAFARLHGISVTRSARIPFEGMIERDERGRAAIYLRRGLNARRERFTLAHEIGHWMLQEELIGTTEGQLFRGVSRNSAETREEEELANLIAAEILMPFGDVHARFDDKCKWLSIDRICHEFGVSRTAAARRVADVCGTNVALLQIVPLYFDDVETAPQIDDAMYITARKSTLYAPETTRMLSSSTFREIAFSARCALCIRSPKGQIGTDFEIAYRRAPIPHALALACIPSWPTPGKEEKV